MIEATGPLRNRDRCAGYVFFTGHIADEALASTANAPKVPEGLSRPVRLTFQNGDRRATGGKTFCHSQPYAGPGTGNDSNVAVKSHIHHPSLERDDQFTVAATTSQSLNYGLKLRSCPGELT